MESISSTFYARLFRANVSRETFLYLDLRFKLFWRKNIGAKAARRTLVKLTHGFKIDAKFTYIPQHVSRVEVSIS